ncbi:hypothetical protein, partial [Erwinia amylovora]|uniref:hypothetical protein n=1 Tax=Erwinia amylovora TaxID=552 RepID=UPI001C556CA2
YVLVLKKPIKNRPRNHLDNNKKSTIVFDKHAKLLNFTEVYQNEKNCVYYFYDTASDTFPLFALYHCHILLSDHTL